MHGLLAYRSMAAQYRARNGKKCRYAPFSLPSNPSAFLSTAENGFGGFRLEQAIEILEYVRHALVTKFRTLFDLKSHTNLK